MKNKSTEWTPEEDAQLAQAVIDKISPERLSVRLHRSVGSIKRRMRELGVAGRRRDPYTSGLQVLVETWLEACRAGELVKLVSFYETDATLECACTGPAIYAGIGAIIEYWAPKLLSDHPKRFVLERLVVDGERIAVDYLSYEAKPVRMYVTVNARGKIARSECGPRDCMKWAA